jgi:D-xylose transport system permease protein
LARLFSFTFVEAAMSNTSQSPALQNEGAVKRFFRATEIDARMLGMVAALFVIWCAFDIASGILRGDFGGLLGGSFLTPRNLWILLNQTSSIAIMSTGMVLLIVMRHIDLSVGSMLSLVAIAAAVVQSFQLEKILGVGHPMIWISGVLVCVLFGALMGAYNGLLTAYAQIPSFVVTLGGLISLSGLGFLIARGETVPLRDPNFAIFGGNIPASWIGPYWSWVLAAIVCVLIIVAIFNSRTQRQRFKFPLRPIWAEVFLTSLASASVLGTTYIMNSYAWPYKLIENYAKANNIPIPPGVENKDGQAICMAADKVVQCAEGLIYYAGYSVPALLALIVAIVMTFISSRTQFGRYVFAAGGNPEAAELAGINTKWLTVKVFVLMGILVGIGAVVASSRLNAATNALGQLNELYIIAAAVIGGTSLAGGVGRIYGAVLGALVMQSIISGMGLLNLAAAYKDIVVGQVLVLAVWFDQFYSRRVK